MLIDKIAYGNICKIGHLFMSFINKGRKIDKVICSGTSFCYCGYIEFSKNSACIYQKRSTLPGT